MSPPRGPAAAAAAAKAGHQAPGATGAAGRDPVALLGAFAFILAAVEYSFPKPLPFMRLGIANLPLLLAIDFLPLPAYLLLALVKFIGMGLVSGTLFSYVALFSLAGTFSGALAMRGARALFGRSVSHIGVSVLGAFASSGAQLLLAGAFVFGAAAWVAAPLFLGTSLVTGAALGLFATAFTSRSAWYAGLVGLPPPVPAGDAGPAIAAGLAAPPQAPKAATPAPPPKRRAKKPSPARLARAKAWDALFPPAPLAAAGGLVALSLLFQPSVPLRALAFLLLLILVFVSGKKISVPASLLTSVGIVLANLAVPVGQVLLRLGPVIVTETALLEGLGKALAFQGLLYASKVSIRPGLRFPGRLGSLVSGSLLVSRGVVEGGFRPRPAHLVEDVDALLARVEEGMAGSGDGRAGEAGARKAAAGAWLLLALAVILALGLLAVGRLQLI